MAQPKRKRPNDEDDETRAAAAQTEKTRRVTRQTSIPPPLLPPKETKEAPVPQRRTLRGSSSAVVDVDMSTDLATVRRSQVRTRRASKLSSDDVDDDVAVEDHEDDDKGENEQEAEEVRTTRSKAKALEGEEAEEEKEGEPKPDQQRRLRGGKTITESEPASKPRPAAKTVTATDTKRRTRQAAKGLEIADSDEAGDDDEEAEDSRSIPDSEEQPGDHSEEDSSEASPPHTRRTRKADLHASEPVVSPLTPPHAPAPGITRSAIPPPVVPASAASTATTDAAATSTSASQPRKETTIKPPSFPIVPASTAAPPVLLAAARPKKVTEIKPPAAPPAPRFPPKTTPIQPPIMAAFASAAIAGAPSAGSKAPAQVHNQTQAQRAKPTPHQPPTSIHANPNPQRNQQQFTKTTITPITAPRPSAMVAGKPTATSTSTAASTTTPAATTSKTTAPPASPSQPDRNIDKVVLGEICFKAWYPSYYGKEVLGDGTGNTHHGRGGHASKGQPGKENHVNGHHHHHHHHNAGHKDKENTPILDRLYVCPFCFKYSREIVPWHGHVQVCESQFQIPGEKVYVHPRGVRTIRVPIASNTPGARGNKRRKSGAVGAGGGAGGGGSNAVGGSPSSAGGGVGSAGGSASAAADHEYIEQVIKDEGEWSIWEVDGERDVLFCQNISLFAKLFLDTKSVFFDVTGFKYFLLVYTPPPSLPSSLRAAATATLSSMSGGAGGSGNGNGAGQPPASILGGAAPRPRVVGFFSKEKMSWDNNNLACILVFPPWQRKGLGALLMGISYEISRREGVLGGPEKPISDLGKKGYKRFWAGEIARWLLGVDISAALSASRSSDTESAQSAPSALSALSTASSVEELVIDIDDCSAATWIVRDDCLYVLREMGIVEDAGMGPPKRFCENVLPRHDMATAEGLAGTDQAGDAATTTGAASSAAADTTATVASIPATAGAAAGAAAADTEAPPKVKRVRLSKAAVRQWVRDNRISLDRTCDPAGFIKDYSPQEAQAAEEV
ncbi:histone acetyltransferase [Ophiostoma piceae UAMH 11346]|uniref:Histone acetyltransferase n=1 Tax=Ophiostoma piceae (strain UAMH 11346) TaxID=1262450 RepID=S3CRQ3_OPHP1|nr:histone acetyltransferase [Ophiostoma piceae UAMH 11346]